MAITTVITYFIAGIAKLRIGGADWLDGSTLTNHIGYSATRMEVLGGFKPPLAPFVSGVGIPDYVVWSTDVLAEGDGGVLAAGWFDHRWQVQPGGFLRE